MSENEMGWNFDNSYARLPKIFFSTVKPVPVKDPKLVIFNIKLAERLGLNKTGLQGPKGVEFLAGNIIPHGAFPLAQAYAGHQFGYFTMLGDGRAHLIGEQVTPQGERFDIQLKGSGKTPYSRGGDGRAALGPMLREYIISEGMYALGIPTTRSLAVITTGEPVYREKELKGAILTRVASSHIRVGTFQYGSRWGTIAELKELADYTIKRHYPEVLSTENPYLFFLYEVIKRQAKLIASWQLVGFVHGVMNTDNMSISGETIDYGPCAFMDTYNPKTVFSSIDRTGRYSYGNQPKIGAWNLARFAETLLPLIHKDEDIALELAKEAIGKYGEHYHFNWLDGMRKKLGLFTEEKEDENLILKLLEIMEKNNLDYTNTFRSLTLEEIDIFLVNAEFKNWYNLWRERLKKQPQDKSLVQELMKKSNPSVIPRNHKVEEALEMAVEKGDYSFIKKLLDILSNPYGYCEGEKEYIKPPDPSSLPYRTFCGT